MAYADQDGMSTNRLVSVVIVLLLHAFLGYALVTGLAYDAVIAIKEKNDCGRRERRRATRRRRAAT